MKTTIEQVAEFHKLFSLLAPTAPIVEPPAETRKKLNELAEMLQETARWAHDMAQQENRDPYLLRVQLMAEELAEVVEAMAQSDPAACLHELADLRYVCDGTAVTLGLGALLEPAVAEIHRANLSKLGRNGKPILNGAGRVVKGPDFRKADVRHLLK